MNLGEDVPAVVSEQLEHQLRMIRKRSIILIPCLIVVGFGVSILGLIPAIAWSLERGSPTPGVFVFSLFTAAFGRGTALWLLPFRPRPRIVPYFARALGDFRGDTSRAFPRGRNLYREIAALDRLARTRGVKPLTAFGFAYDHFEQDVRWHAPSEGLGTAEALREGLEAGGIHSPEVASDLEALALVLREAVEQGVDFSLVLRLHEKDSLQGVCSMEERQGSFW